MSSHKDRLADYIEVPDRIKSFKKEFPDGSLQGAWRIETLGDRTFIVYTALAFRTPDDERPGEGNAWEPFPGKTPYTKDSELMNAETSAWGRALVALGFVGKKIASKEEVQARQDNGHLTDEDVDAIVAHFKKSGKPAADLKLKLTTLGVEGDLSSVRQAVALCSPEQAVELSKWIAS